MEYFSCGYGNGCKFQYAKIQFLQDSTCPNLKFSDSFNQCCVKKIKSAWLSKQHKNVPTLPG